MTEADLVGEDALSPAERARAFYAGRCPLRREMPAWGEGDDSVVGGFFSEAPTPAELEASRAFQQALHDAGLAWLEGPEELGGSGLSPAECLTVRAVAQDYVVPDLSEFHVGQRILSPALEHHGSRVQQDRWLAALWRGDAIACQLFSEPEAGSDLASLTTRAMPVEGGWVVNGQKVWSSGARDSDVGELLARTGDDGFEGASLHRGLSMFLLDMRSPGVTVRPLRQLNGNAHFCEVFLDDVFIPDEDMLGGRGQGWTVALTSLASERNDFAGEEDHLFLRPLPRLLQLAGVLGESDDPVVRQQLADTYIRNRVVEFVAARLDVDRSPSMLAAGPSLLKLCTSDAKYSLAQVSGSLLGLAAVADDGEWGHYCWSQMLLGVFAPKIAGGTDEIQRNVIAERGLGLPREPRGNQHR